jgi:hypothetical protein
MIATACGEAPTYVLLEVPASVLTDAGPEPAPDASVNVPDAGPPLRDDGLGCTRDRQCAGGNCLRNDNFPGGYCTRLDCQNDRECNRPDGVCTEAAGERLCAAFCLPNDRCRAGYTCTTVGGDRVCLPEIMELDREDGEPCTQDNQCRGGSCLLAPEWPDGHCTTMSCNELSGCANHRGGDNQCVNIVLLGPAEPKCLRPCQRYPDCRAGYACDHLDANNAFCVPDVAEVHALPPAATQVICGRGEDGIARFTYQIPAGTTSYLATPFTRDGRRLFPHHVELPSGSRIDFLGDNNFQTLMANLHGFLNPTVIPATRDRGQQLEFGAHVYEIETWSEDVCLWLTTESTPGPRLELRIYLTGLAGFRAATAANDPIIMAFRDELAILFAQAGLQLARLQFRDVPEPAGSDLRFIDDFEQLLALMALAEPIPANRDQRVANVFLVEGFGPELGVLGVSTGLPGPVGLHGTRASGVVLTAELLGQPLQGPNGEEVDGTLVTANVAAHELGHYLGLFHTTGSDLVTFDPIDDTAECPADQFPFDCPDFENLMFPFADPAARRLTPGQAFSLGAHPLTKE